jgi:hypothetical protein
LEQARDKLLQPTRQHRIGHQVVIGAEFPSQPSTAVTIQHRAPVVQNMNTLIAADEGGRFSCSA